MKRKFSGDDLNEEANNRYLAEKVADELSSVSISPKNVKKVKLEGMPCGEGQNSGRLPRPIDRGIKRKGAVLDPFTRDLLKGAKIPRRSIAHTSVDLDGLNEELSAFNLGHDKPM